MSQAVINFYGVSDEHGCFSNFAAYPIELGGECWPTSEHYFQAQKFDDAAHREAIRNAKSPMVAARMGRDRKKPLRQDWESVKMSVMTDAVRAKFTQHGELRAILLATGDAMIIEHTKNDSYWGDGGDGSGRNMLGQILMQIREELRPNSEETGKPIDPDEITWITDQIAITNFYSAHQKGLLAEHAVSAILCLDRELLGDAAESRGAERIEVVDLVDGPNDMAIFERAVAALESLVENHSRVVVHCRAGRSRSIAVVAAYLKRVEGLDATAALEFVGLKRPSALAPELVRLVERF
jgi:hypothetical protein